MIFYVARDFDGTLTMFTKSPDRDLLNKRWVAPIGCVYVKISDSSFDDLTWESTPIIVKLKRLI